MQRVVTQRFGFSAKKIIFGAPRDNIILCTKHVERFMLLALRIIARCARLSLPVVFVRTRVRVVSLFAASLHALW